MLPLTKGEINPATSAQIARHPPQKTTASEQQLPTPMGNQLLEWAATKTASMPAGLKPGGPPHLLSTARRPGSELFRSPTVQYRARYRPSSRSIVLDGGQTRDRFKIPTAGLIADIAKRAGPTNDNRLRLPAKLCARRRQRRPELNWHTKTTVMRIQ